MAMFARLAVLQKDGVEGISIHLKLQDFQVLAAPPPLSFHKPCVFSTIVIPCDCS